MESIAGPMYWPAFDRTVARPLMNPVMPFISPPSVRAATKPSTTVAFRFPNAPSMVLVEEAASTAASSKPSSMMAWLNSSAVISPFAIASRKSPVYAPFFFMASCRTPEAPGIASASWFQFSVVSLPAPAVWVRTIATDLNVSALPPATAFRLPAASVRAMKSLTPFAPS